MRIHINMAFAFGVALLATVLSGQSSDAAMKTALPAIDAVAEKQAMTHEVRKRRHWRKRRLSKRRHWRKRYLSERRGYSGKRWRRKRHFSRSRRHRRYYRHRPRFILRFGHYGYRDYYYDDYYGDNSYYRRSSCGTIEEKERCERKYRSFEWDTCRYTTYSGRKRLCPYVR